MRPYIVSDDTNRPPETTLRIVDSGDFFVMVSITPAEARPWFFTLHVPPGMIQMHVQLSGSATFAFSAHYQRPLSADRCFMLFEPGSAMTIGLDASPASRLVTIILPIATLHRLVLHSDILPFIGADGKHRSFHAERGIPGKVLQGAERIIDDTNEVSTSDLLVLARAMEVLHDLIEADRSTEDITHGCPFLRDQSKVERLRNAKRILIERYDTPPTVPELARLVGMNEYELKLGFKRIYGAPIHTYVHEYRMERARKLLDQPAMTVNEAAYAVGYSNPSHFIAAFKRRYGTTPKQYMVQTLLGGSDDD